MGLKSQELGIHLLNLKFFSTESTSSLDIHMQPHKTTNIQSREFYNRVPLPPLREFSIAHLLN